MLRFSIPLARLLFALLVSSGLVARQATAVETGNLAVRVLDDETGATMPARLVLKASDGTYPGDRLRLSADRWPNIDAHAVFIDGEETFELPAGTTSVTAARGMQYRAETESVDVRPGETASVELRLRKAVDMKRHGWVAGDLHVHMIHGENQRETSYEDVALTCRANGLDFVSVGQEYVGAGTLDLAGYHAACRAVSAPDFQMFLGAERPKNILGHQVLLGVENPFLISEEPPYWKAAHAIHEQGGVAVYVHPIRYYPGKQYRGEWLDFPGNNLARALIFDAYAGPSFDGLSVLSDEPANATAHQLWFELLNRGCFVPVFADSDACFDRPELGMKAPGFWNTYFYIGPGAAVTPENLVAAVRQGRTMATTGPLVRFSIDGEISGATFPPDGQSRTISIDVYYPQHAFSLDSVDAKTNEPTAISRIELLRNGVVAREWTPKSSQASVTHTIAESDRCWYATRVYGSDAQWQVALASPIYFDREAAAPKDEPFGVVARGRIYDFETGRERSGQVEIVRHGKTLKRFDAEGQFRVRIPIDAEIVVTSGYERPLTKNLLLDYGPVHRFLWHLESADLGQSETFERFERLVREVDLEFPIGHSTPGSFFAAELTEATPLDQIEVLGGPEATTDGSVAVASVLLDTERIAPGDKFHVAAIFRDEGTAAAAGPYVIEARGYDPAKPTGFGALKKFATVEATWEKATDLGEGYKLVAGEIAVPAWVEAGPTGAIDLSVRARRDSADAAFVGLSIPLGPTKRALSLSNGWPTMPLSWPDRDYGIGPYKICNRLGRKGAPKTDYRQLRLSVQATGRTFDLLPERDARGVADADDACYADHFYDQVLGDETHQAEPTPVRSQPQIVWRNDLPLIDATAGTTGEAKTRSD
ncbi:MAG TPA: CehA/McbA family metallohydrolase [Pirellulaceae bacterium]|jgi:hypothetical protein|nr:CehA/McbA family metallohydrolase [Pirellulaceae bacterium]